MGKLLKETRRQLQTRELVFRTYQATERVYLLSTQNPFTPQASLGLTTELNRIHQDCSVRVLTCQLSRHLQPLLDTEARLKIKFEPTEIGFSHPINFAMREGIKVYAVDSPEYLYAQQILIENIKYDKLPKIPLKDFLQINTERAKYTSSRIENIAQSYFPLVHLCSDGQCLKILENLTDA
jgi:hypothetical protein